MEVAEARQQLTDSFLPGIGLTASAVLACASDCTGLSLLERFPAVLFSLLLLLVMSDLHCTACFSCPEALRLSSCFAGAALLLCCSAALHAAHNAAPCRGPSVPVVQPGNALGHQVGRLPGGSAGHVVWRPGGSILWLLVGRAGFVPPQMPYQLFMQLTCWCGLPDDCESQLTWCS
jgi:hypothetical protein